MPKVSLTVVLAFFANLVIAIAKTVAALFTGSASITAEAAHSWADTGNEIFLLVADRRGGFEADASHPLGYGRETYFWSTIAAFGLFTAGAVVSIWHGIQELLAPSHSGEFWVAYLVLGISLVFEGISFAQAFREARSSARQRGKPTLSHVLRTSNPTLRAVFAEDAAALVGLAIAFLGVLLHQLTGNAAFDALGSILVGLLLGVVAVILIERNRRFLVGQVTGDDVTNTMLETLLQRPDITRVTYMHLEFVGPERIFLVARVDLTGNDAENRLAYRLRAIEDDLEANPHIQEAILTLARDEDAPLLPS